MSGWLQVRQNVPLLMSLSPPASLIFHGLFKKFRYCYIVSVFKSDSSPYFLSLKTEVRAYYSIKQWHTRAKSNPNPIKRALVSAMLVVPVWL